MRNGRRVYDADTHGGPSAELLEPYLGPTVRELVPDLEEHKSPIKVGWAGEIREAPYKHFYRFSGGRGILDACEGLVEQCLSEYDLDGWTGDTWLPVPGER